MAPRVPFNVSPIALAGNGFNDWVHASERLSEHERSKGHMCAIRTFAQRADIHGRVDLALQNEVEERIMYWEKVLHRLISVIRVLSECGLALRGDNQKVGSPHNGNYLGLIHSCRIIRLAPYATFIPCFGHSLNLVGKEAASSCSEAVSFFDLIQALYVFFTASTSRHKKLFDVLQKKDVPVFMPKRLSDTRWSCRFDAVQAVKNGYEEIMNVLQDISEDTDEKAECRCTAKGLYDRMCKLETGIFTELWHVLLDRFNQSSKTLQSQTLNLNAACGILQSLTEFVIQQRDAFDEFEKRSIHLSGMEKYTAQLKRKSRHNTRLDPLDYGHCVESELSERESFRIKSFIPCMDSLIVCLQNRHSAYKDVAGRYGFLVDLPNMSQELLIKAATNLSRFYSNDLDDNFAHELVHFQIFLKGFLDQKENHVGLQSFMYKLIMDKNVEATFPNMATVLKIYLTLMVSNCSGERSFSKMKVIKNLNRTTMGQMRFTNLSRMSIESDLLRKLDFSDIVHKFASDKARKVLI